MQYWDDTTRWTVLLALKELFLREDAQKERVFRSIGGKLSELESSIQNLASAEKGGSTSLAKLDARLDAAIRVFFLAIQMLRQAALAEEEDDPKGSEEAELADRLESYFFPEGLDGIIRRPYAVEVVLTETLLSKAGEATIASVIQSQGWEGHLKRIKERKDAIKTAMEEKVPAKKAEASAYIEARKAFDSTLARLRKTLRSHFDLEIQEEKNLHDAFWKPILEADRVAKDTKARRDKERQKKEQPPTPSTPSTSSTPSTPSTPTPPENG